MLSVPTLWTVFVINFLALGLIWAYVMRSYPAFAPARFWTASSFVAAAGATVATLRIVMTDSLAPLMVAGTALILAVWIATLGIQKIFGRPTGASRCWSPRLAPPACSFSPLAMKACPRGWWCFRSPRRCRWCSA
jgi:hypothetical protein